MINRGLIDVGALVARDEIADDAMSKFEEAEMKQMCNLEKSIEKSNKKMEKLLIGLVRAVKEVVFLLKCVIFLLIFLDQCS